MNPTLTDGKSYGRTTNTYYDDIIQNQTLAYGYYVEVEKVQLANLLRFVKNLNFDDN